jgi:Papain-like cysteine protease AvrRpt2
LYFQPRQWAEWLNTFGPLWVVIVGMPHAVVLAGIRGDLDKPDSVEVHVLNPWDTRVAFDNDPVAFSPANNGYSDWLSFNRFAKDFGTMAESDYGRWRVLHLPASVATSQGLSSAMSQNVSRRAPPPRSLAVDSGSTALREPIEPSHVIGTTMHRVRGQSGRVTYVLEQLEGFKSTDTSPTIVAPIIPQQIVLDAWPRLNQDPVPMPLLVRFASDGSRVGDIRIEPVSTDASALPYDVDISAIILDGNNSSSSVAAINVRIDYLYRASDGEHRACTELTLYGNGRNAMSSTWK